MSAIDQSCCPPCPTPAVNIPGTPGATGAAGANGTNGLNSGTITTADFVIPAVNASVTVLVASSLMFAVGQKVFASDGTDVGTFQVVSFPSTQSVVLLFLGYTGDSSVGTTITAGALVVPSGGQGPSGFSPISYADASVGGAQALTTTPNTQALAKQLTLDATGGKNYMLFARCRFDYVGATFAGNQVITLKLRRTNNTAGDVASAIGNLQTLKITTQSYTAGEITIIGIPYTSQGVSDIVQPMVSIDGLPSAGSVNAIECSISAIELT